MAKRLRCRVLDDTGAPTSTAQAPPRAETLCGPHHQAALRRLCRCERFPPPRSCSPTPAPRHDARTPPSDRHRAPFLPQSRLCVSGLGRLGQSPRQWPSQWRSLAAAAVCRLSWLFSRDSRYALSRQARLCRPHCAGHRAPGRGASIMASATLCFSRWTQRRRRQLHRCQNRRKHRARLLPEKALRCRRPVRPREEKVVNSGKALPLAR